jgi:hypothetical protein
VTATATAAAGALVLLLFFLDELEDIFTSDNNRGLIFPAVVVNDSCGSQLPYLSGGHLKRKIKGAGKFPGVSIIVIGS